MVCYLKVTMQDVAREAGVDKATVSRALSGDPRISEKTRAKVMDAVRKLNYHIDKNARNLSTNSSRLIGVVLAELAVPWLGAFLSGLDRVLAGSEYELLVKSTGGNAQRAARELGRLRDRNADGVIWADAANRLHMENIHFITLGYTSGHSWSITSEDGGPPGFETGALAGRLMLRLISGKTVPSREIIVKKSEDPSK